MQRFYLRSTSLHSFEKEFGTEFWVFFHPAWIGVVSGKVPFFTYSGFVQYTILLGAFCVLRMVV